MRGSLAILLLCAASAAAEPIEGLLDQANAARWEARWPAIRGLAGLHSEEAVFEVRRLLLADPRPRVREAIAWACHLEPRLASATLLRLALRRDKEPTVRRAVAQALRHFPDRRAIDALVKAFAIEPDRRTRLHIVESLRALTPAPCLLDPDAWKEWWSAHAADPRFRPADEAARSGTYEGVVLETRTMEPVGRKKKGKPPHILVLPGFGWTSGAFGPYLLPLRRRARITWVGLPSIRTLTGQSGFGDNIPTYPVARLVRALDRFRADHKVERFAILAQGASGWIAMRYAVDHADRCSALLLVDTALDKKAYADGLRRAGAHGTKGERYAAKTLLHENNVPLNERTLDRLNAIGLTAGFLDPADPEIGYLFHHARQPEGFATVPEIRWARQRKLDTPALFFYSASSGFAGHLDRDRIQRHFPKSLIAPIQGTRGLPYVEANEKFHAVLDHFLDEFLK